MKLQKLMALVAAVFFLAAASTAFANTQISVGSNSQPIPYAANADNCNKGGDLTFRYQPNSVINAGDAFIMDLDVGTALCRKVDLWYRVNNATTGDDAFVMSSRNATIANGSMYIRVVGNVGERRVNVRYYGTQADSRLIVAGAPEDFFEFRLFNQKISTTILKKDTDTVKMAITNSTVVNDSNWGSLANATVADNTLCISHNPGSDTNTQILQNEKVNFNLVRVGSSPNAFSFVGGQGAEPQVGHFISLNYKEVSCLKAKPGKIQLPVDGQTAGTCLTFDYETDGGTANGYCAPYAKNKFLIEASPSFEVAGDYYFDIQIKVNGFAGENGVYFDGQGTSTPGVAVQVADTLVNICNATSVTLPGSVGNYRYYRYGQTADLAVASIPTVASSTACLPAPTQRIVRMTTPLTSLGLTGTQRFLWVDLPSFRYDRSVIKAGDTVSIEVSLMRDPCVKVGVFEKQIGTFGCDDVVADNKTLIFPYFTQMAGDDWWDGVVITNMDSVAGTATFTFYEKDGDKGTFVTPSVPAYSMYVNTLSAIAPSVTKVAGAGTMGDSPVWARVVTQFGADGFAMIGSATTGQSMGYLPRVGKSLGQ